MGAGRSVLWAPVLVGHVVHLVHFVLVVLGQKKNRPKNSDKKSDRKIGQKSEKKSHNKSYKIRKRDIQSSKASNFKPDKKIGKTKEIRTKSNTKTPTITQTKKSKTKTKQKIGKSIGQGDTSGYRKTSFL